MTKPSQYAQLKDTWVSFKENFFVAYAVDGPMASLSHGTRYGLPVDYPLVNSPVKEPSPLNNRWQYNPPWPGITGIL